MQAVRVITGRAVPLNRSDVDTDQIIPAEWLKRVERTGFGVGLFSAWRDDRAFILNDERFSGASVLLAGPNFGTGSSREHAVWAIMDYGFAAVISPRFGDIFKNNAGKNGLVTAQIDADVVDRLMAAVEKDSTLEITIDVERLVVAVPALGIETPFPMDPSTRDRFLQGLDEIGITEQHVDEIDAFERTRAAFKPSVSA
ncbi:MAG: 3-isopropylmalate dehydratase small subunit [Actinobacteria bacterium]|nr:3-isopropylmalate dehydratase small subunit [Actinomycetota bacterium]